jgi:PhoPQ-activated pathogenicity-related protein
MTKKKLFVQNTLQKINWTSDILVQKINWTSDILVYVPDIYVQVQDFFF